MQSPGIRVISDQRTRAGLADRAVGQVPGMIHATLWPGPTEASMVVREVLRTVFRLADIALEIVPTGDELLAVATHAQRHNILLIDCCIGGASDVDRCVTIATHSTLALHIIHPREQTVRDLEQVVGRPLVWWPADFTVFSLLDKLYTLRALVAATAVERLTLTARELEVLELIVKGHSNRKIGACLYITEDTTKTHVRSIMRKLSVTSRREIIAKSHAGELEGVITRVRASHQR
jgi:DNA-binding CsgD family transcriptional regulator